MAAERLQKVLARAGFASRRAAEALITDGRVRVNGHIVSELGAKADPHRDKIELDGRRVTLEDPVYLVLHKPRGVISTMSDPEGRMTVHDLLKDAPGRVYPVGRLDYATSGVLLATNDGDFAVALMHPRKGVPKTYVVKVAGVMQERDVDSWRRGVKLEDGLTLPAKVSLLRHEGDKTWLELTIREGRNQQIRRMGEATGFSVMRLARVSFAGITSEGLRPGMFRALTRDELVTLRAEYGVPKRLPRGAEEGAQGSFVPRVRRTSAEARRRGSEGEPAPRARPAEGPPAWPGRSGRGASGSRAEPQPRPGYGGGAPGRRSEDGPQPWGQEAGRGSSSGASSGRGGRDTHHERGGGSRGARGSGGAGGRGGAGSRTTGTGGGIGASRQGAEDDSYSISKTRHRR